ncbi:MAG TPA: hypothetical protein VE650_09115 [Acetobacteraceae bacterium]|nr:hypothetical protein [Acetobacteraceae bacterium]
MSQLSQPAGALRLARCAEAPAGLARAGTLLLWALASCTGSSTSVAMQPDFAVMTPAGLASVSIRQAPVGRTQADFAELVRAGMERAAPGSVIAGPLQAPFPSQRIVWHATQSISEGDSRVVVSVYNGANPYAYEQDTLTNVESAAGIRSTVRWMSERLMADIADQASRPSRLGGNARPDEANQADVSSR